MNTGPHAGGAQLAAHGARSADDVLDCNDVAKDFAIIPAIFLAFYPQLQALSVMNLANPQGAILSAIIFNALIVIG